MFSEISHGLPVVKNVLAVWFSPISDVTVANAEKYRWGISTDSSISAAIVIENSPSLSVVVSVEYKGASLSKMRPLQRDDDLIFTNVLALATGIPEYVETFPLSVISPFDGLFFSVDVNSA